MRCLFVVDDIVRFRELAVVLNSGDIAMIMVKEFALAGRLANAGDFDMVIVGVNSFASDSMRFLQGRRIRRCPVVAVTCESGLRRTLLDAGADRVVLLPDDGNDLKLSISMLTGEPVHVPLQISRPRRLWQHFGL
jgi:DNA-binding response OmpR family regulator